MKPSKKRINIVSLELVRESSLLYGPRQCLSVQDAYELASPFIEKKDREHLLVIGLNTKNEPTVINIAHTYRYRKPEHSRSKRHLEASPAV
ncbi:hypothetical protein [Vagococcus fluvialis]|uniref:hypothetical protein n=1 Tax=Vagococcus fluvialis TaxID=2738 RepID=UPI001F30B0B4|nr:hypothetical protein [Vagococcus fluvialis]